MSINVPGMKKIEHLVILMMENRSFDHYLGSLSLVEGRAEIDGLTPALPPIPDQNGNPMRPNALDGTFCGYGDPPHGWDAQHANYNGGAMDGFVRQYQAEFAAAPQIPMAYYTRRTLPVLYALSDYFTVCDKWFSSVLSSTWPNRKYLHSSRRDDDNDTQTIPPYPGFKTSPLYNALEDARDPDTGDRLTWKCYFSDLPFLAFWYDFAAFHALSNFTTVDRFLQDCRQDTLPTVSVIDPPYSLADDHPSHDVRLGQKFIGLIVDALTYSESWQKTALVLLYDENGAFYDHVAPPPSFEAAAGQAPLDDPLGFRVPAVVISPYSRRNACHTVFDHTSVLKSIATRWNIGFDPAVYGNRWQLAPDIWSTCFDFTQPPLPPGCYTQTEAEIAANADPPFKNLNWETGIGELATNPVGSLEGLIERIFILPTLKLLDKRAALFDTLTALEQNTVRLKRMVPPRP